ncbi:methyl-accepting chemotaxis protein [Shewanella litorisediminis]|uniref:Methyl-accepting chemotaxis protein n=1 Tax=Shewanella litorisediminis TaxID=1173586 RepID=A0ABX7G0P3_9GAMM|nr:methyl-accepting chemotaxis protein [Shewanella litorisediminis]MCL2918157.1 methyl-accepting chemotaxis protein [Shewanella litorisediminis]QRH00787.1 methyl-accepting chemotaxis protein [Shewanella litorisediminis]
MFSSLRLSQQLYYSFGVVIVLLLVVTVAGYRGLTDGFENFSEYGQLAKSSNAASEAEATLLRARVDVLRYLNTPDDAIYQSFQKNIAELNQDFTNARELELDAGRDSLLAQADGLVKSYASTFKAVTGDFAARNQVVRDLLDPAGLRMRENVTDVITAMYQEGDAEGLFIAARSQEKLMLARLFAASFLISNREEDYKRALQELSALDGTINGLKSVDSASVIADKVQGIDEGRIQYRDALKAVFGIIQDQNKRINEGLNVIGPNVAGVLEEYNKAIEQQQDELGLHTQQERENAIDTVVVVAIAALLLAIWLAITVVRGIRRPVGGEPREMASIAREIAGGNLGQNFQREGSTGIYAAMAEMNDNLRRIVSELTDASRTLGESSSGMLGVTQESRVNSESQADQLVHTASAMQEMTHTVDDIARNAQRASEMASEADHHAQDGMGIVEDTRRSIMVLVDNIRDVSGIIENLEKETENVGAILGVIRGIAEQTNLLALNAAIEAARAGEQGRGFAVVADEVRNLASRTQNSTAEIQALIGRLQAESRRSVESMRLSVTEATQTSDKANKAIAALGAIADSVMAIRDMNHQIAVAAEEQTTVVNTINLSVEEISALARKNAQGSEQVQNSANGISGISSKLSGIVGRFRL